MRKTSSGHKGRVKTIGLFDGRSPWQQRARGDGAATSGRARGGEEVVRCHDPHRGPLLDVTVAVDTARSHDVPINVDLSATSAESRADRRDTSLRDSDVGAKDIRCDSVPLRTTISYSAMLPPGRDQIEPNRYHHSCATKLPIAWKPAFSAENCARFLPSRGGTRHRSVRVTRRRAGGRSRSVSSASLGGTAAGRAR